MKPIIFLINNGGYTIEVEIHDGPYNTIKNWDYSKLVEVFGAGEARPRAARRPRRAISTGPSRKRRAATACASVEVTIDRDDCNVNLLRWGNHVARNNGRPNRCQ